MKDKKIVVIAGLILLALSAFFILHFFPHPLRAISYSEGAGDGDTDEAVNNQQSLAASVDFALASPREKYQISSSTPQFVLLSFDGSKSVDMLNETLAFEQKMQSEGKPLHFTYFIHAADFLTKDNATLYQAPRQLPGVSNIGFSESTHDILFRVKAFNYAFAGGNEIGSHSVGHYNGGSWSYDEWKQEFSYFNSLMADVSKNNPSEKIDTPTFLNDIHGFRAPDLGVNDNLYKVLKDFHFAYDASGVGKVDSWPKKDSYGVWHIPLGIVLLGENKKTITAMDYNLWMRQSGAKNVALKGTPLWDSYFNQVENAYMDYFNTNYNENRAPIVIGDHFSKWNDGVYWEAMKAFAENVCGKPQVRCVTFSELVNYLNTNGAPQIVK